MKSIRASLIWGSVLGVIGIYTLSGVAIYRGARATLVRQLDESLEDQVRVIASVVKRTPDGIEVEIEDIDVPEFTSAAGHGYLQLWLDADSMLYRSPRLDGHDVERRPSLELNRPVFRWIRTVGGVHARAVDLRTEAVVDPEDWEEVQQPMPRPPVIYLVAAEEARSTDAILARLRALLVAIGGVGSLAVAATLAGVIRRSLRPLNELAREIADLSDDDLSARIRVAATAREVKPVVDQLNELMTRLDAAFQRERTFSSDIAHELRTPLAGLRTTLEVTLSRPRDEHDYRESLDASLGIVRRVQTMVETLLYLGRLESGQVEVEHGAVNLCEMLGAVWTPLADRAQVRRISVAWILPGEVSVMADPVLLEVALRNVLDNAVSHVDDAGSVRIEVSAGGDAVHLRVANSGSGIPQERVGDLLRRFTRADPSRKASAEHFGLGLALTSKIAVALNTGIEVESSIGGEFSVSFWFPRA